MNVSRDDFWGITTYFNLTNGRRRYSNYQCFRRNLSVPLLTMEWHPEGAFQLEKRDADILVQLSGGDMMWQKERLLNIAVKALPDHVKHVAWMDCDLLFANPNWADEAAESLRSNQVIQLYSDVVFPDEQQSIELTASGNVDPTMLASAGAPSRPAFLAMQEKLGNDVAKYDLGQRTRSSTISNAEVLLRPAHGYAWGARAGFLRDLGLYDRCIIGSGDMHFCYGISGLADEFIRSQTDAGISFYGDCASYRAWASRASEMCLGHIGSLGHPVVHLFHGDMGDRKYRERIDSLLPFSLDLDADIWARDGEPWLWKRDRAALNTHFLSYMHSRREDAESKTSAALP